MIPVAAFAGGSLRTVAVTPPPRLDFSGSVDTTRIAEFALNDAGQVAFTRYRFLRTSSKTAPSLVTTILREVNDGRLEEVSRTGEQVPVVGVGVTQGLALLPTINNAGSVQFFGRFEGPGVDDSSDYGYFRESSEGGLQLVVRAGEQAIGEAAGVTHEALVYRPSFNSSGHAAFQSILGGPGVNEMNSRAIYSEGLGGGARIVARGGRQAAGAEAGVNYGYLGWPILNDAGLTAFRGELIGPGIDTTNNAALWRETRSGVLRLIARAGEPAPGATAGVRFGAAIANGGLRGELSVAYLPVLNDSDETIFVASLDGAGVGPSNDTGIWRADDDGDLELVAREGQTAPGAGAAAFGDFDSLLGTAVLSNSGRFAFRTSLVGDGAAGFDDKGIWRGGGDGKLELVARVGDPAPGLGGSARFNSLSNPLITEDGRLAFLATLTGAGVDDVNSAGIWAESVAGGFVLIARTGDVLDVDNNPSVDDMRTIEGLRFVNGFSDGPLPSTFNKRGELAFGVTFTDGSTGLFVSSLVAVPEPTGAVLVVLGALAGAIGPRGRG